jgi:hypothetical protein
MAGVLGFSQPAAAQSQSCDRECLRGILTAYLNAMVAHTPRAVATTPDVRFTENDATMKLGDGLWQRASRLRPYRLDFIDVQQGVAGTHTIVEENGSPDLVAIRLKIVDRKVDEAETLVVRNRQEGVIFDVDALQQPTSAMTRMPEPSQRTPRDEAVRIAERYPAGLKTGSFVSVDVPFASDAYRLENGRLMAGPGCTFMPGCEQIKTQRIPTLAGITYRVLAVDEDLGIVWLAQSFGAGSIPQRDEVLKVWEAFKVYGGQIHAVEAFMRAMPPGSTSIWDRPSVARAAEEVAPRAAGYARARTPWPSTVGFPLTRMPDDGMFEYACHDGNHGLRNLLSAARAGEQASE